MSAREEPEYRFNIQMNTKKLGVRYEINSQKMLMDEFMAAMSLNHSCIRVKKRRNKDRPSSQQSGRNSGQQNNENRPGTAGENLKPYQGTSPDEITLVTFARALGYEFRSSSDHFAKLKIPRRAELD